MAEVRDRVVRAEEEQRRKIKYGLPVDDNAVRYRGKRGPRPGDTVVVAGKEVRNDGW